MNLGLPAILTCIFVMTICEAATTEDIYTDVMRKLKVNLLNCGLKQGARDLPPPIDLVFLVDESPCVGKTNYVMLMRLTKKILDFFSVSPGTTRVGFATFSDNTRFHFQLNQHKNRKATQQAILKLSQTFSGKAGSKLGQGLSDAISLFSRFTRPNTQKILVVVTSGASGDEADNARIIPAVSALEAMGVKRYVISLGKEYHGSHVDMIKSRPTPKTGPQLYHFVFDSLAAIRWVCNLLPEAYFRHCTSSGTWRDECRRECQCVNGHLLHCKRIREEVNSMSVADRTLFVSTYRNMTTLEPFRSRYNAFIAIHSRHFFDGIHEPPQFLPWHRWFLVSIENLLKEVDCRVTVPYWDWSIVSQNPWNNNTLFSDKPDGIGGTNSFDIFCVRGGPFGLRSSWRAQNGNCLSRTFMRNDPNFNTPDAVAVETVLRQENYVTFEDSLRVNLHDTVHCLIGGIMCSFDSAVVPEFFLHHSFVDKIWGDKQNQNQSYFKGNYLNTTLLSGSGFNAHHLLDNTNLPGMIAVMYANGTQYNAQGVRSFLKSRTLDELLKIRRKPTIRVLDYGSLSMFRVSNSSLDNAFKFKNETMEQIRKYPLLANLTGNNALYGFELPAGFAG